MGLTWPPYLRRLDGFPLGKSRRRQNCTGGCANRTFPDPLPDTIENVPKYFRLGGLVIMHANDFDIDMSQALSAPGVQIRLGRNSNDPVSLRRSS